MMEKHGISTREWGLIWAIGLLISVILGMAVSSIVRSSDGWAAMSAWGALIGAILSFLGIIITAWIAWKSYGAAQISAEISRRSLNANRSWMMPSKISAIWNSENPNNPEADMGIYIHCAFQNFGGAPALDVNIEYWLEPVSRIEDIRAPFEDHRSEQAPAVPHGGELPFFLSILNSGAYMCADGEAIWHIRIEVSYKDVLVDGICGFSATYGLCFEYEGSDEFGESQYTVSVEPVGKPEIW